MQFTIEIPAEVAAKLEQEAAQRGVSLASYVQSLAARRILPLPTSMPVGGIIAPQ